MLRGMQREGRRHIDVNHTSQHESFIYLSSSGFRIPAFPYACLAQVRAGWYISLTSGLPWTTMNGQPKWTT